MESGAYGSGLVDQPPADKPSSYECAVCKKYFRTQKIYERHMRRKQPCKPPKSKPLPPPPSQSPSKPHSAPPNNDENTTQTNKKSKDYFIDTLLPPRSVLKQFINRPNVLDLIRTSWSSIASSKTTSCGYSSIPNLPDPPKTNNDKKNCFLKRYTIRLIGSNQKTIQKQFEQIFSEQKHPFKITTSLAYILIDPSKTQTKSSKNGKIIFQDSVRLWHASCNNSFPMQEDGQLLLNPNTVITSLNQFTNYCNTLFDTSHTDHLTINFKDSSETLLCLVDYVAYVYELSNGTLIGLFDDDVIIDHDDNLFSTTGDDTTSSHSDYDDASSKSVDILKSALRTSGIVKKSPEVENKPIKQNCYSDVTDVTDNENPPITDNNCQCDGRSTCALHNTHNTTFVNEISSDVDSQIVEQFSKCECNLSSDGAILTCSICEKASKMAKTFLNMDLNLSDRINNLFSTSPCHDNITTDIKIQDICNETLDTAGGDHCLDKTCEVGLDCCLIDSQHQHITGDNAHIVQQPRKRKRVTKSIKSPSSEPQPKRQKIDLFDNFSQNSLPCGQKTPLVISSSSSECESHHSFVLNTSPKSQENAKIMPKHNLSVGKNMFKLKKYYKPSNLSTSESEHEPDDNDTVLKNVNKRKKTTKKLVSYSSSESDLELEQNFADNEDEQLTIIPPTPPTTPPQH